MSVTNEITLSQARCCVVRDANSGLAFLSFSAVCRQSLGGEQGWLIDDITLSGAFANSSVTPSTTGPFTGNSWSGNISAGSPGAFVLVAAHSNGVSGFSAPLNVGVANDWC